MLVGFTANGSGVPQAISNSTNNVIINTNRTILANNKVLENRFKSHPTDVIAPVSLIDSTDKYNSVVVCCTKKLADYHRKACKAYKSEEESNPLISGIDNPCASTCLRCGVMDSNGIIVPLENKRVWVFNGKKSTKKENK